ncbi:NAD(P)-dependent oxidoreductase [Peribacillus saganii]|uniref:NAD(P)-dependent oxidoreductase n=1 Tax=Peribacillus saganii TaxID=2303992 RepID=A0A372LE39_9BACI|nr:NAD(P)-dependent oxidoreductase [Peribacillus saganii]RFU64540.1 NAD(P)-dependent oxidoreductase [Peribacillus saganii]
MSEAIGFIGLGKMGLPMAKNLLNKDYQVFGMDVNKSAIAEFEQAGGQTGNLEDILPLADYLILMLPSSTIVNKVVTDIIGLYNKTGDSNRNLVTIDMSSSYPADTRNNEKILQDHNIQFLDAPVSGGVKKAITASLTIMAGGEPDLFEKCKRLLCCMGTNVFHVGPAGSGHLIKAINNYLSATHLLASCEAIQLLESFNVNPETAIHVINQSTGRSGSTEYKFPSFILPESYDSGFSLELMRKDVAMAHQIFSESSAQTLLPGLIFQKLDEASRALEEEADHTEINKFVSTYLLKRGNLNEESKKIVSGSTNTGAGI